MTSSDQLSSEKAVNKLVQLYLRYKYKSDEDPRLNVGYRQKFKEVMEQVIKSKRVKTKVEFNKEVAKIETSIARRNFFIGTLKTLGFLFVLAITFSIVDKAFECDAECQRRRNIDERATERYYDLQERSLNRDGYWFLFTLLITK